MKPTITSVLILATSLVAQARLIQNWSDQELYDQSDLVVIAAPTTSADTRERTDLPGLLSQHVIGVETGFVVSAVVKGDKELKNVILHHYRVDEERSGLVVNGPNLIAFKSEEKRKFLLFLKREADGRYAPTVGQLDPGFQGIAALGDPMSASPNSPPHSDTLSDSDLRGVWHAQFAGPHKDSMLGAIEWLSITFQKEYRVDWKWKREGKIEEHKGTYSLSEILVNGARSQWDIALNPGTMAVYRPIPLKDSLIDHDSRFPSTEKVLKCLDHEGNQLVFSREQAKTK